MRPLLRATHSLSLSYTLPKVHSYRTRYFGINPTLKMILHNSSNLSTIIDFLNASDFQNKI